MAAPRWTSVLIGRNGLGKSRMLGALASMFVDAANGKVAHARRNHIPARVTYSIGEQICELRTARDRELEANLNGSPVAVDELPLPSKVIAVSTTVLDKFPLPGRASDEDTDSPEGLYTYLGLRDRTGRASATAVVYRALEALMDASEATFERRSRTSKIFEFLGYLPVVEHAYRWRYASLWRGDRTVLDLLNSDDVQLAARSTAARLRRLVSREPNVLNRLQEAVDSARNVTSAKRELRLSVDFRGRGSSDRSEFDSLRLLRRAGLIELKSVELQTAAGSIVDLREASSGELSLATALLGIAAVIQDNALVIVDEPEVSLHPEWQSQYLELLESTFSEFSGCHFVVATHSPMIVADIAAESANVVSLGRADADTEPGSHFAGDSIDEILLRAFQVSGKNNLFLKQELVEALRLAADGRTSSLRFAEIMTQLSPVTESLKVSSPTRVLIEQLQQVLETGADSD